MASSIFFSEAACSENAYSDASSALLYPLMVSWGIEAARQTLKEGMSGDFSFLASSDSIDFDELLFSSGFSVSAKETYFLMYSLSCITFSGLSTNFLGCDLFLSTSMDLPLFLAETFTSSFETLFFLALPCFLCFLMSYSSISS